MPASIAPSTRLFNKTPASPTPKESLGHAASMEAEHRATRVAKACDLTADDDEDNKATTVKMPPSSMMHLVAL